MRSYDVYRVVPAIECATTGEIAFRCGQMFCQGITPTLDSVLKHLHKLEKMSLVNQHGRNEFSNEDSHPNELRWRRAYP